MIRIRLCNLNARMGANPVSLRIKSASVDGVLVAASGCRRPAKPSGALCITQATTTCCTHCWLLWRRFIYGVYNFFINLRMSRDGLRSFVWSSDVTLASFSSLWPALTLTVHIIYCRWNLWSRATFLYLWNWAHCYPRCVATVRTRAFVYFIFKLTKNAESYGIVLWIAIDGYNERVHCKKQRASSTNMIPSTNIAFIQVFFFESGNSMQYRSLNAIPDQTGSIILSFYSTRAIDWIQLVFAPLPHLCDSRHSIDLLPLVTHLCY